MSYCFPSVIVRWILNFVDQITHENHENWNPTDEIDDNDFEKDFEEHLAS
jgi:hypothetical protein